MVLYVAVMIGLGLIVGVAGYFLTTKPAEVHAPIPGLEYKNVEKDNAEAVLKRYLEELKLKDKKDLISYLSGDDGRKIVDLTGYYDSENISLNNFEILKIERTGNDEFDFVVREYQGDAKYGVIGYYDNRYKLVKAEEKYLIASVDMGEYIDTSEVKDWKLLKNIEKGYEIRYPENFFYQEPEITVSSMAGSSSLSGCYARNFKGFIVRKIEIGGQQFCLSESTEGAAGNTYVDSSYTNVEKNRIATLHFIVRYPNCGALGSATDQAYKNCDESNKKGPVTVERVVSTFKFIELQK